LDGDNVDAAFQKIVEGRQKIIHLTEIYRLSHVASDDADA
jgi:hypothetical protein